MFRLVADITELNIDQVKLPKIPGLGMLMKLPNKQKISMIVSVLNAQKGQFLPKWQEAVNQKWGQLQLLDYQVEQPGDGSCLARIRIDVGNADYDKAIDSVIPHVFQEKDAHTVLGGDYAGSVRHSRKTDIWTHIILSMEKMVFLPTYATIMNCTVWGI